MRTYCQIAWTNGGKPKQEKNDKFIKILLLMSRSSCPEVFLEISQNLEENNSARISFLTELQALACNFIEKETLTQAFSCEFSEISKTTFSHRTPPGDCFSTSHTSVLFQNTHNPVNRLHWCFHKAIF